jgi:hypothetical protein
VLCGAGCAILLPVGVVLATGTPKASAVTGSQYCFYGIIWTDSCLNAWGGGPNVNAYTGGTNNPNDQFAVIKGLPGNIELEFVGGGT